MKRNENLPFVETWMDLEGFMLGQISQRKKNAHVITYMWNVKNKLENTTKQISQICKTNQRSTVEEERGQMLDRGRALRDIKYKV